MTAARQCQIGPIAVGADRLVLIAGPCMAESLELCRTVADTLGELCRKLQIDYVFKASYDKANRSSADSYRGPGLERGLEWLRIVGEKTGLPLLSDVHEPAQVGPAAAVLDCIQIPAFLCRQTDLLVEAGRSGRAINIKKGQFVAPWDMRLAVEKVRNQDNQQVLVTERGTFFGYNRLVTDFRSIPQMQEFAPVAFDATHSVQEPGGLGNASGGRREYAPLLASAAMATGADALFIETHPDPDNALSDAASQIPLEQMEGVLRRCREMFQAARAKL